MLRQSGLKGPCRHEFTVLVLGGELMCVNINTGFLGHEDEEMVEEFDDQVRCHCT